MSNFEDGFAIGLALGKKIFSGNGGDTPSEKKGEYPSDWLPLPEVGENEVAALIFVMAGASSASAGFSGEAPESVDWGDPNGDNLDYTQSHSYSYDRGTPYNDKASMFVIKAHYAQEGKFTSWSAYGGCFIMAFAVNGSVIDTNSVSHVASNNTDYLQYIRITGNMANFEERSMFIDRLRGLKRVDFENSPTKLSNYTFSRCNGLTSVNLPDLSAVTSVGDCCFYDCDAISEINLPALQTAGDGFCEQCCGLDKLHMPLLASVNGYFCVYCYKLGCIDLPMLETIGNSGFNHCYALKKVVLPLLKSIGTSFLESCYGLETADLRALTDVTSMGSYCYSLREVNMPNIDITQSGIFPQSYMIKQTTEEEST